MASYSKTYGGAVYLSFSGDLVTLTAPNLTVPRFSYKADSFYDAASLGQIDEAIVSILTKFDDTIGGIINVDDIKAEINKLTNIPVLGEILTSELVITEFTIQPADEGKTNGNYAFGFGLRLTQNNTLGPVTLDGVAFSIGLSQTA
jgi:hypothetical protein